jgi:hypothetical protein
MSDGQLEYVDERPSDAGGGTLGRNVIWHDPGNRRFPARGALFAASDPITSRAWWCRHLYDQGAESRCTTEAFAGALATSPNRILLQRSNLTALDAPEERQAYYRESQHRDPWQPEGYEGTSSDAPFILGR